jgi:hypothetical protein
MNEKNFNEVKQFFLDHSVKIQEAIIKIDSTVFFTEKINPLCMADLILFTQKNQIAFTTQERKNGYKFSFVKVT